MDRTAETADVLWTSGASIGQRPPLPGDARCDVCVVGAGIAGLTTAYLLTRAGHTVVVLEDGEIGSGETGRTTAHLANALDDRYGELARLHGEQGARVAADSHTRAIDRVEAIVADEQVDCDFARLDGYLFAPPPGDPALLGEELHAAHEAGLVDVRRVDRAPWTAFDTGPALLFPRQAQFHPMKYLAGLARAVEAHGGTIHTGTHATDIAGGSSATIRTRGGHTVTARAVVVATNTPVNDIVTMHTKQAAYRTYVIGVAVPRDSVPRGLFWDTADPYHYVRVAAASDREDLLIVGGEDHKTGQANDGDDRFVALATWTRVRFPAAGPVRYAWSGQVIEPVDGLAFIGRNPGDADNVYIVTGDSGNGMTHGTIAGMVLTDLISGRENPWAALYDPARVTLRATPAAARENLNVVAQYADLVTSGDIDAPADLAPGNGVVVRRGLKKIAVYRDADGILHERSAICPHLGCVVRWNHTEGSWDCPCHGSRFDPLGKVINGPAISDLK